MERSDILLCVILIVSLLSLWFSWKTYSQKIGYRRNLLENFSCNKPWDCPSYPDEICCSSTQVCLPNDEVTLHKFCPGWIPPQ